MQRVSTVGELRALVAEKRRQGMRIGFVPTMGALHEGHLSLIRLAGQHSDYVVVSVFVNPTQFNSAQDLERYPRVVEQDARLCEDTGADLLFVPEVAEIYPPVRRDPESGRGAVSVRAGIRSLGLCGAKRPGHFDGVVTVVSILFHVVQPDLAVFGEKDYQQLRVIESLVEDLHFPVSILAGPTVRDPDGLAMSSRNLLLSAEERFQALYIPKTLTKALEMYRQGERRAERLCQVARENLDKSRGLQIDYIEIVETDTLLPVVGEIPGEAQMLIAAFAGQTRLIDNVRLGN